MPVFLTPVSKVALLEQSMKIKLRRDPSINSTCFPMVLLVNRGFIYLARKHAVYRFCMALSSKSADFWFGGNETGGTKLFQLSVDQAYKWIKFLNPPFFEICDCKQDSPYLGLMSCVNGKMGFHGFQDNAFVIGVIKSFWFQISELTCTSKFLKSSVAAALPSKKFDRLYIEEVGSTDDLKRALKQKATRLTIRIKPEDEFVKGSHAPHDETFVNSIVEKCEVDWWFGQGPIFGIISKVVNTCPNLKHLKIDCGFHKGESPTIESAVMHLVRTNVFIERLVKKLKEASVECVVSVYLNIGDDGHNSKYPHDCVEMFQCCIPQFESVQEKTQGWPEEKVYTEFTIKHKDQNVSIDYCILIGYDYLEDDDVDEMYEDNILDDGDNTSDDEDSDASDQDEI